MWRSNYGRCWWSSEGPSDFCADSCGKRQTSASFLFLLNSPEQLCSFFLIKKPALLSLAKPAEKRELFHSYYFTLGSLPYFRFPSVWLLMKCRATLMPKGALIRSRPPSPGTSSSCNGTLPWPQCPSLRRTPCCFFPSFTGGSKTI